MSGRQTALNQHLLNSETKKPVDSWAMWQVAAVHCSGDAYTSTFLQSAVALSRVTDHWCGTGMCPNYDGKERTLSEFQFGGKFVPKWEAVIDWYFVFQCQATCWGQHQGLCSWALLRCLCCSHPGSWSARVDVAALEFLMELKGFPFMVLPGISTGSKYCILWGFNFDECP